MCWGLSVRQGLWSQPDLVEEFAQQGKDGSPFLQPLQLPMPVPCSPAGQRWSAACAYLHPALSRPNLTAKARAFVSRVLFEGPRAVGVEYTWNGQSHRVSDLGPQQPHDGNGSRDPGVMPSGQESGSWPFRTGGEAAGSSGLKDCPGLCMSPAPYEEPAACACPSCRRADCVPSPPCQTWAASQEDPDNGPCGPSSFPQRQDCLHPVGIRPSARFM